LDDAVAQIGGQARQSQDRGFATPRVGMAGPRTQRVVMDGRQDGWHALFNGLLVTYKGRTPSGNEIPATVLLNSANCEASPLTIARNDPSWQSSVWTRRA